MTATNHNTRAMARAMDADTRRRRRETLEALKRRPTPWTDAQWREWAAVAAADVLDRGYARPERDPTTGRHYTDHAFAVGHRVLVVGPGWDALAREIGARAARHIKEVPR